MDIWITNIPAGPSGYHAETAAKLRDLIIGAPMPTIAYTVEQFREMGVVGLYRRDKFAGNRAAA